MALAKYFSKNLLAINRLVNTSPDFLSEKLNKIVISIAFDENALSTYEGQCSIDMLIRLMARFYPQLSFVDLSRKNESRKNEFEKLAKSINANIELLDESIVPAVSIVVGYTTKLDEIKGQRIFIGSNNWISKYSMTKIQDYSEHKNPFGAGVASCVAASNVFRIVFSDILQYENVDNEFLLSTFSLTEELEDNNPLISSLEFDDLMIVGVGAIGNGTIWALSKIQDVKGEIHLIDNETVSLSNLQRYILFDEDNENMDKVELAAGRFEQLGLSIQPFKGTWAEYVNNRQTWDFNCLAVAIDNEKDRISIQSSLPRYIFNAFTEPQSIGISRHKDFVNDPCLACSYIPTKQRKSYIHEVADNCNISQHSEMVKDYYNLRKTVDDIWPPKYNESLLMVIANANRIAIEDLNHFKGMQIQQFYSSFVCGGVVLTLSQVDNNIQNVDAPLAFQSALAGILLAAEIVKHFNFPQLKQQAKTDFYHLGSIQKGLNPYHRTMAKDTTNRCFCRDEDFIRRFYTKWKTD